MDSTLPHEALARFEVIEQRLDALEGKTADDSEVEETEPEPTPEDDTEEQEV